MPAQKYFDTFLTENKNVLSFTEPREGEATFAPKMTEKVKSLAAPDGSQVEFVCKVEGSPRPQITWFRQTAIIKPSQDFQVTLPTKIFSLDFW